MDKPKKAVMVGINKITENTLRMTLDDVVQANESASTWNKDVTVTFKDYNVSDFKALIFTEKELADFGYAVIARLHAFLTTEQI